MGERFSRRFTLLDALVLIAAAAMGLAVIRIWTGPDIAASLTDWWRANRVIPEVIGAVAQYNALALILLRVRQPRPPWRELRSQAGLIACLAVVLAMLNYVALEGWRLFRPHRTRGWAGELCGILLALVSDQFVAPAIALAWLVLLLSGGWKRAADWIDRAGRFVGFTWLALYAHTLICIYWEIFF